MRRLHLSHRHRQQQRLSNSSPIVQPRFASQMENFGAAAAAGWDWTGSRYAAGWMLSWTDTDARWTLAPSSHEADGSLFCIVLVSSVHVVRARGGNLKYRAMRLDAGNFAWGTEATTRKTRILDVVYNSSNNELVRTKTLVKGAIVQIDATPFRQYYEQTYNTQLGKKKKGDEKEAEAKKSKHVVAKLAGRNKDQVLDPHIKEQFSQGRLYASLSSRPGQSGRADGYILEGKELDFYLRKLHNKKK
jgi:small subunit ribosomal protein S8e